MRGRVAPTESHRPAVDDGQREVHQNQVGALTGGELKPFGTVSRGEDVVGVLQELHDEILG